MSIWRMLGLGQVGGDERGSSAGRDTVRQIVDELADLPIERARYIAMFAFILSRVAGADSKISPAETRAMERIVVEAGGLPEEQAMIVVQMAKTQSLLFGGTDNYSVTKEFAKLASREQKFSLLRCLFAVSAADQSIATVESNVIRQIADELGLDHADFAALRSEYRQHLAVLRPAKPDEA
ncbi:MAG TPA: TerB family tellurite resistance protein [Candidatus Polarisedimenticolaceae bacterium]|nr:TerB family tellurite resistance protein [Candidatus Polarisedimenticolaceae bacterium]